MRNLGPDERDSAGRLPQLHRPRARLRGRRVRPERRVPRETDRVPIDMLGGEHTRLHALPVQPHTAALGEGGAVGEDQTIRWGLVRSSTRTLIRARRGGVGGRGSSSSWHAPPGWDGGDRPP